MEALSPSDGELMRQVQGGDRDAFAALVDRYKDPLVGYLCRLTGQRERAEDVAQEAFLRVFAAAARYRDQGSFGSYLFQVAINLVRSQERRKRRWRGLLPALSSNGHGAPPVQEGELLGNEEARHLRRALAKLPLAYRAPLLLFEVEGWSQEAIAGLLGCRVGTVKSRLHRGRRRLRDALGSYRNGGPS